MQESKLIILMKNFSDSELADLKDFVYSPYHNESKLVTKLFEYIYKTAPRFLHTRLEKQRVWKAVFPKEKYNDVRLRKVVSNLYKTCLNFVSINKLKQNEMQQKLLQLEYFREHKLIKHFDGITKQLNKYNEKTKRQDETSLYYKFCLEKEISINISIQQNRTREPNLQEVSDHLDAFYILNKLKTCCKIVNYQNLTTSDYEIPLINEVLSYLEQGTFTHIPIISFYHSALLGLQFPENEKYFTNLKDILKGRHEMFTTYEFSDMMILAKNYCIKRANKGNKQFLEELFELYLLEIELLKNNENAILSHFTYKNVVTLGIRFARFEWTEQFLKDYKYLLPEEFRDSVYSFNLSRLYFSQSRFSEIIPLLIQVKHNEIFMELDSRVLLMRTYYELDEYDALYSYLESFNMFLHRKDIINYHRKSYKNLINAIRQMIRLSNGNTEKIATFRSKIENEKELIEKVWVLEKIVKLAT